MKKQYTEQNMRDFAEFYRRTQGQCSPDLWGKDLLQMWIGYDTKNDEKEWEVISYLNLRHFTIMEAQVQPDKLGDPGRWAIHSIKRINDGEIFTLGDKIDMDECGPKRIDAFWLGGKGKESGHDDNSIWISINQQKGYGTLLEYAIKIK